MWVGGGSIGFVVSIGFDALLFMPTDPVGFGRKKKEKKKKIRKEKKKEKNIWRFTKKKKKKT
jgi:hypothetical protein